MEKDNPLVAKRDNSMFFGWGNVDPGLTNPSYQWVAVLFKRDEAGLGLRIYSGFPVADRGKVDPKKGKASAKTIWAFACLPGVYGDIVGDLAGVTGGSAYPRHTRVEALATLLGVATPGVHFIWQWVKIQIVPAVNIPISTKID